MRRFRDWRRPALRRFNLVMRWVLMVMSIALWGEFSWLITLTGDWALLLAPVLVSVVTAAYWYACWVVILRSPQ